MDSPTQRRSAGATASALSPYAGKRIDAEARTHIVAEIEASGRTNAESAEYYGVHRATVARWIREEYLSYTPIVTDEVRRSERAVILESLKRKGDAPGAEVAHREKVQGRWEVLYKILRFILVVAVVLICLSVGSRVIEFFAVLAVPVEYVTVLAFVLGALLWTGGSGLLVFGDFLFRMIAPYPYLYMQLRTAHDELGTIRREDIFRRSDWSAKRNSSRRKVKRAMARAERVLASDRLAGGWSGAGARQAERDHRKNAAANLSAAEWSLGTEGPSAYPSVRKLLRTLMTLTTLRDWSFNGLQQRKYKIDFSANIRHKAWRLLQGTIAVAALPGVASQLAVWVA